MPALTCNIYYTQLAIGNTKKNGSIELSSNGQDIVRQDVWSSSKGPVGKYMGICHRLYKAGGPMDKVVHRHIGNYGNMSLV
jgi:hypothetical protein